jgi:hypothetical protein
MHPQTHLTLHADGQYSLINQGMPITAPMPLWQCRVAVRKFFPQLETLEVWSAELGEFVSSEPMEAI